MHLGVGYVIVYHTCYVSARVGVLKAVTIPVTATSWQTPIGCFWNLPDHGPNVLDPLMNVQAVMFQAVISLMMELSRTLDVTI
jgi:hypothetical protein